MTPNVSRLLLRWGVADIVDSNLVEPASARMRRKDGGIIQSVKLATTTREYLGFPVSGFAAKCLLTTRPELIQTGKWWTVSDKMSSM